MARIEFLSKEHAMANIIKDMYGNILHLDSNNQIIMQKQAVIYDEIFEDKVTRIPITDKEYLKEESIRATNLLNATNAILNSSPYTSYQPKIYKKDSDTLGFRGYRDSNLYVLNWKSLYLKDPLKGKIAPWTKKEKAYYESLKTKKERYAYLVARSGLQSAFVNIPLDAIGGADEKGRIINEEYEEIFQRVSRNRGTLKSVSHGNEWELSALLLGDINASATAAPGFNARIRQALFLRAQLGDKDAFESLSTACSLEFISGLKHNPLKGQIIYNLVQKHNTLLDRFGMIPYLDELIGVDWVMDFGRYDIEGDIGWELYENYVDKGLLLDPRDAKATKQSREEFRQKVKFLIKRRTEYSSFDIPYNTELTQRDRVLAEDIFKLVAKVISLTPPQGYPNAPYYYLPEDIEEAFEKGELDFNLDPRIPAIERASFPQNLKDRIYEYAKKHNIKDEPIDYGGRK